MDLSILVQDTILYIKVVAIIKSPKGFLFEKKPDRDYIFLVGGKMKINETSEEAIRREVLEEIGMEIKGMKLCSMIENLFTTPKEKFHEICFVYKVNDIFTGNIPEGFVEVAKEDLDKQEIKPKCIVGLLKEDSEDFKHIVN